MNRRVVVTGLGAITPIGNNVPEFWSAVKQQKVGIGEITHFDATDYKCHLAAEVKDFDAKEYMDFRSAKRMEAFCQFAVAAAGEALEDSGLSLEAEDAYRVGTSISSGVGSLQAIEREHSKLLEKGPGRVNPLFRPDDDFQYGSRKCIYSVWIKRKELKYQYRLCIRNECHW